MRGAALLPLLCACLAALAAPAAAQATFSGVWDVLAPFPRGFRELGADPLACWGGITGVTRGQGVFPSELGADGVVGWSSVAGADGALGPVDFAVWNSTLLQAANGWPAVAWQGWAVTDVEVPDGADATYAVQCLYAPAFYVDATRFHGDPLAYGLAPALIYLPAGNHTLAVQLQNGVEYGGVTAVSVQCSVWAPNAELTILPLPAAAIVPDLVDGALASPLASITVLNGGGAPLSALSVLVSASAPVPLSGRFVVPSLAPGQVAPLPFELDPALAASTGLVQVCVVAASFQGCLASATLPLANRTQGEPFAFTFADYDGTVQYAVLRLPPEAPAGPLVVALHGPGIEASAPQWTASVPVLPSTAVLYPSGRRPYGFEWHGPSALNVLAAIKAAALLPALAASDVDFSRIIWLGHSAGGAGAWLMAARYPDRTAGLLVGAPFISLTQYVPWTGHLGRAHRDAFLGGAVEAAQAAQDGDVHAPNLLGLPVMLRYGANDTVVSPWHSRRLARLVQEQAANASAVRLSEEPDAPHWFPSIFSGAVPAAFLAALAAAPAAVPFPSAFQVVVLDPASSGPRASLLVLQLAFPFRTGRLTVRALSAAHWTAASENLLRFCVQPDPRSAALATLTVDATTIANLQRCNVSHYCLQGRVWSSCSPADWSAAPRRPQQLGPSSRLYERSFSVVYAAAPNNASARAEAEAQAVQVANDWLLHGGGNATIYWHEDAPALLPGSLLLLGHPDFNSRTAALLADTPVPLYFSNATGFGIGNYGFAGAGVGLLALVPLDGAQLALIVSGTDDAGQRAALEALPFRPALLSTDWLALSAAPFACSGVGGVLGAGFWGNGWQFMPADSYVRPSLPLPETAAPDYALFALLVVLVAAAALMLATAVGVLWSVLPRAPASGAAPPPGPATPLLDEDAPHATYSQLPLAEPFAADRAHDERDDDGR